MNQVNPHGKTSFIYVVLMKLSRGNSGYKISKRYLHEMREVVEGVLVDQGNQANHQRYAAVTPLNVRVSALLQVSSYVNNCKYASITHGKKPHEASMVCKVFHTICARSLVHFFYKVNKTMIGHST